MRAIVAAFLIIATCAVPTPDTASSAIQYLQQLFADQPEVVQKVTRAWEQESSQPGVRNPWTVVGPGAAAATLRGAGSSRSSEISCQICKDLNTLYEADLPQFTSRMEGQLGRSTLLGDVQQLRAATRLVQHQDQTACTIMPHQCGPVLCCRAGCWPGLPP